MNTKKNWPKISINTNESDVNSFALVLSFLFDSFYWCHHHFKFFPFCRSASLLQCIVRKFLEIERKILVAEYQFSLQFDPWLLTCSTSHFQREFAHRAQLNSDLIRMPMFEWVYLLNDGLHWQAASLRLFLTHFQSLFLNNKLDSK